jgi:predicted small metal-binding protein
MKQLKCCDVGFDCKGIIVAETEAEVLQQAAQHAIAVHGVSVTPEMATQIKTSITDVAETS